MLDLHRHVLHRNQELLESDLIIDEGLFEELSDVFTASMAIEVKVCGK